MKASRRGHRLLDPEPRRIGARAAGQRTFYVAAFRNTREEMNEVELIVPVTPELVEGMDPDQVPPCGPGMQTTTPDDLELYLALRRVPFCSDDCNGVMCQMPRVAPGMIGLTRQAIAGRSARPPPLNLPRTGRSAVRPDLARLRDGNACPRAACYGAQPVPADAACGQPLPGMIGPVGYDQAR